MNLTQSAVLVLLFVVPAFIGRAAHFRTHYYRFARLKKAEEFLPFFVHDWQFAFISALPVAIFIQATYYGLLYLLFRPSLTSIDLVVIPFIRPLNTSSWMVYPDLHSLYAAYAVSVGVYGGSLAYAWLLGVFTGFIRWNIIELRYRTVPNPWFYIMRPVGDDKATVLDVLCKFEGKHDFPIMYRGVAAGLLMGRDSIPAAISLIHAYRVHLNKDNPSPANNDFDFVRIPGQLFVIRFEDIRNVNVASIIETEFEATTRRTKARVWIRKQLDRFWTR